MDIMSGLAAGANFGQGFLNGQQQDQNQNYTNRINELMLQSAEQEQQQKQQAAQQQQAIEEEAKKQQATQDPSQRLTELGQFALNQGDLTHANQLFTNATNLQSDKLHQELMQSAAQTGELKRQAQHYTMAGQLATSLRSTMGDTPQALDHWKAAILSDPNSSPQERQGVMSMSYYPGVMDKLTQVGMTAAQQATAQLQQQRFQQTQQVNAAQEAHMQRQDLERAAHDRAMEQRQVRQEKVGAAAKAPTSEDLRTALPLISSATGIPITDPLFNGPDVGASGQRDYNTPALVSIVSRAKQLVQENRALTFPQAVTMAASEAKKNGELQVTKSPDTHSKIFGLNIPFSGQDASTQASFNDVGNTQAQPLPFTGQPKGELIQGKYYKTGSGVLQWTGTGWKKS